MFKSTQYILQVEKIYGLVVNSLTNDKTSALTKLKTFADDEFHVVKMMISVFDKIENVGKAENVLNIVGKGENAGNQHFLLFPQCFQKASYTGLLEVMIVWQRINSFQYHFSNIKTANTPIYVFL